MVEGERSGRRRALKRALAKAASLGRLGLPKFGRGQFVIVARCDLCLHRDHASPDAIPFDATFFVTAR